MSAPPRRVLLADDDALFLRLVEDQLKSVGIATACVREPTRVVPIATSFEPHLIVMDRNMPVLTGTEVIRSLRAFPQTENIPVVFLMGDDREGEILKALRGGAVDVLLKPFTEGHTARVVSVLDEAPNYRPAPLPMTDDGLLASVLRYNQRLRRSGTLVLNPSTPFEGRARFEEGKLASAEYGPLFGRDALREMLWFEDGSWRFEPQADALPSRPPPIDNARTPFPRPAGAPITSPGRQLNDFRPKVLFVDDDLEIRKLFQIHLSRGGFDVELAEDGEMGRRAALERSCDLIIADLNMPKMDGWGMLRLLKADHHSSEIPIVFLSAHDDYRETLKAARCGAHDYLPKMVRPENVVQRALWMIAPKIAAYGELLRKRSLNFDTHLVGVQWLLRTAAQLGLSGEVSLEDEWGRHSLWLRDGLPADAKSANAKRNVSGIGAVATLLVSRCPRGRFDASNTTTESRIPMSVGALLRRCCDTLNQLEARITTTRLSATEEFFVDEELYQLFRSVGGDRDRELARAICEQKLRPADAAAKLHVPLEQVQQTLRELLRRSVITFPAHAS